ncbi:MAG: hypothetical protein NC299_18245 [Lachnospiraceae bacterium]|nr:hypothetical protein [Lachnospiraceae bacterium]
MLGRKASEETKRKMSESQRKRFAGWTDEERKAYGKRMSELQKGIPKPYLKEKMKNNKNGAKFTVDQVKEMRRMFEREGMTVRQISDLLKINKGTVDGIVKYRRWKDVV